MDDVIRTKDLAATHRHASRRRFLGPEPKEKNPLLAQHQPIARQQEEEEGPYWPEDVAENLAKVAAFKRHMLECMNDEDVVKGPPDAEGRVRRHGAKLMERMAPHMHLIEHEVGSMTDAERRTKLRRMALALDVAGDEEKRIILATYNAGPSNSGRSGRQAGTNPHSGEESGSDGEDSEE